MPDTWILQQLTSVIADQPVDEVLVALPIDRYGPLVERIIRQCEEQGIIVRLRTEMSHLRIARAYVDELQGVPVMTIQSGPVDSWQLVMKRLIDIAWSAAVLLALTPLFTIVALLIRLDSPGAVFFYTRAGWTQ